MPCRVGITTNPSDRRTFWEGQVVGLRNWTQQYIGSKNDAQNAENSRQASCNGNGRRGHCHAHHGGGDPETIGWYVYEFDYDRSR